MQPNLSLPIAEAESWFEPYIQRPWVPSALVILPLAILRFLGHLCIQWAAALAYYTLIGLVPLLAAVFAIIKGLGLHRQLTPFVINTIGAGSPEIAQEVVTFIDTTNVRGVFVLSAIGAALAIIAILTNAELCLNHIWGDVPGRTWRRKFRSFALVAVTAPLLLVSALALTALLQPGHLIYVFLDTFRLGDVVLLILRVVPYALLWLSFTLFYTAVPNRVVRTRSAVFGAVVAGTLWQFAQWGYVTFVIKLVRYSAVYGTLWQIPILLAWVYIAWSVILYGAEVSRVHQEVYEQRLTRRRGVPRTPDTERDE
jgi:membrane protein